jgi:hypothetical protein
MLVCKFLDGPEFVTTRLMRYADGLGLSPRSYSQERDEGYYALHFYATFKVDLLNKELQAQESHVELEIQTTTQLQEILKGLTYTYYKESRTQPARDRSKWKWEYETNRFKAGYLGHTLHLMEAIIVELRNANSQILDQVGPAPDEGHASNEPSSNRNIIVAQATEAEAGSSSSAEGAIGESSMVAGEATANEGITDEATATTGPTTDETDTTETESVEGV